MFTIIKRLTLTAVTALLIITPLHSAEVEGLWGISKSDLLKIIKTDSYEIFKPSEKPQYKNKIIDFFNSMDPGERSDIIILRIPGKPELDYCFFNGKLYSVSEEWGEIEKNAAERLFKNLETVFSEIKSGSSTDGLYTFKKNRTKVLLHKKDINKNSSKIRVFYYSMDLFNLLLRD